MVDLDNFLDQRNFSGYARIGGEKPGGVGQQHEQVRHHEMCHQRGESVVVPETDLVVRGGVVLVHDRHDPELEEARQRPARVQVLLAVPEVQRCEEHLADGQPVAR